MYKHLFNPINWIILIACPLFYLAVLLPYPLLMQLGKFIGLMGYHLFRGRRQITQTNIERCFPHLNPIEQQKLVRANFISYGMSLFEETLAFLAPDKKLIPLYKIHGLKHIEHALEKGKGVLLLSTHLTAPDFGIRLLTIALKKPIISMYRTQNNALIEHILSEKRNQYGNQAIDRKNIRLLLKSLTQNKIVWYAPDQNTKKHGEFVPFFGIQTAMTTATARIAALTQTKVIPFFWFRETAGKSYRLELQPLIDNFPSKDINQDTEKISQIIETAIKKYPEQYLWMHRKFRTRPKGEPPFYPKKNKGK